MKNQVTIIKNSLIGTLLGGMVYAQALPDVEHDEHGNGWKRGEVLVQFTPDVTDAEIAQVFERGQLHLLKHVRTRAMEDHDRIGLTRVFTAMPVHAAVRFLSNLPGVEFVEPNWVVTRGASNDPLYLGGNLWGMYGDDLSSPVGPAPTTNPFGSQAEKAWAAGFTGSKDVFVAVIDEGLQYDHPDLAANVWTNPGEIPGNGVDDDANGYIDDVHGWNAIDNNGNIYDAAQDDHGTHVAGTLGAVGNNGIGVAGMAWNVSIVSGKFLSPTGGTASDSIEALDYITSLKVHKGLNIVAINASWGGGAFSQARLDALARAAQAGILFCAAAMNNSNNNDLNPIYPSSYDTSAQAGYDSVISVAAIDSTGALAGFSDYGATSVDLGAPGVQVYSTLPNGTYGSYNGTSMATPHVTGAIALYAASHPGTSPAQIRQDLLTAGARPTPSLAGKTFSGGRLDTMAFLSIPPSVLSAPIPPASAQATAVSGGRVDVTWVDQASDELGFAIERSTDGVTFTLADTVGANRTSYSDRTVRPGTTYFYRVRAYNGGGSSAPTLAPTAVSTPNIPLPVAPASLTASAAKAGINLAWVDRSNNEEIFVIERKTGSGQFAVLATVPVNTTKYTDSAVEPRITYSYRARAYNVTGFSDCSNTVSVKAR